MMQTGLKNRVRVIGQKIKTKQHCMQTLEILAKREMGRESYKKNEPARLNISRVRVSCKWWTVGDSNPGPWD